MSDNIFQRMSRITAEISAVAKNLQVGVGKGSYKAAGEADVLASVKPIENKYGVYSYPIDRSIVESGTMERETQYGKSVQLYMRIRVTYRFLCIDNPESYIDIVSYGDGVDSQDKAPGKAMTYADKYALMKAYKIITGDDPDQNQSEEQKTVSTRKNKSTGEDAQRKKMLESYPPIEEMIEYIKSNYDAENTAKMLKYYKVNSIEELLPEQIVACYNRKRGTRNEK